MCRLPGGVADIEPLAFLGCGETTWVSSRYAGPLGLSVRALAEADVLEDMDTGGGE